MSGIGGGLRDKTAGKVIPVVLRRNATSIPNPVHCSRSAGDRIEWQSPDCVNEISFDDNSPSPFGGPGDDYIVLKGSTMQTNPVRPNTVAKNYDYDILSDNGAGGVTGSGTVIVDP